MPRIPVLNDFVRLERRITKANDGAGNPETKWLPVGGATPLRVEITEYVIGAGEAVMAGKLEGKALCEVWARVSPITRAIQTTDRFIDLASLETLNIRHCHRPGRDDRFMRFLCERGVA